MLVPRLLLKDSSNRTYVSSSLDFLTKNLVGQESWKKKVRECETKISFAIAHNNESILLKYYVVEPTSVAKSVEDNGEVWKDSCVEFFVAFDDDSYYNFECNCIGSKLLGYKNLKTGESQRAQSDILENIEVTTSLLKEPFEEKRLGKEWSVVVKIPKDSFFKHRKLGSLSGVEAKANFYKCGDDLKEPHYLSWKKIFTEKPNFHTPKYFGRIKFQ